jgi:hypothetical protein
MYGNNPPKNHPTGTTCRPDFVAIRTAQSTAPVVGTLPKTPVEPKPVPPTAEDMDPPPPPEDMDSAEDMGPPPPPEVMDRPPPPEVMGPPPPPEPTASPPPIDLVWSQLEATGEIRSKGTTDLDTISQTGSYTVFLLQARPDLVSVTGIFVNPENHTFRLFFMDAWRHCYTDSVKFDESKAQGLLMTWIRRLYNPELTPNIERVGSFPQKPTFTVTTNHPNPFMGCTLFVVGSIRRRATIFEAEMEDKPLIIKSQYHDEERRFEESQVLENIHASGDFPGVVRVLECGSSPGNQIIRSPVGRPGDNPVLNEHRSSCMTMRQTLLVLKDRAGPLMGATTPLEALIAIYDLLEGNMLSLFLVQTLIPYTVTRFLYTTRDTLHRDISEGNVLFREEGQKLEKPAKDLQKMCFATHLLGEPGPNNEMYVLLLRRSVTH